MKKKILMAGNEAIALGAIDAGCRFYAGYPITPQNELTAYMAKYMPRCGGIFIQAESELAAINMVFGAAAAGAQAMTSSSSPGISLKQEGISYIAGAQLPAVIVNIMRAGPGLGNIWPAQSDYFQATRGGGNGDYHCIVLAPDSVQEAYDLMPLAFTLADKYRNPVMILGDGMLGQMMEPLYVVRHPSPVASARTTRPWALTGCKGRRPNIVKSFYMREGDLEKFNLKLQKKYNQIREKEQRWEEESLEGAKIIVAAYGTMSRIAKSAVNTLRQEGKKIGLIRPITLWPFPEKIFHNLSSVVRLPRAQSRGRPPSVGKLKFLVIEMSYGQMIEDVKLSLGCGLPVEFLGRAGGGIPSEEEIIDKLKSMYGKSI